MVRKKKTPASELFHKCAIDAKKKGDNAYKDRNYMELFRQSLIEKYCKEQEKKFKK